ncbi:hypothetical protein OAW22_08950 [Pseudomonadales bacterium]|nr:hypothetical protein [Pseudomonadales bacterium]
MLDGAAGKLKYDVTLTRGSGEAWRKDGDPYLLTARFLTEMNHWYNLGLTVVQGEFWQGSGLTSKRDRVAVDGRVDVSRWTLKGQISNGHNGPIDARRSLLEAEWTFAHSEWTAYLQRFVFELGNQKFDQETHPLGVRFEPTNHLQVDVFLLKRYQQLRQTQPSDAQGSNKSATLILWRHRKRTRTGGPQCANQEVV